MQVSVRDNNVDQALRALKKKLQREGVFREMKLKQHFEKPSVRKAREKAEAIRRQRKLARKKLQREGLLKAASGVTILNPRLSNQAGVFFFGADLSTTERSGTAQTQYHFDRPLR